MKNILHIVSSPRGEESNSTRLGNRIIERLRGIYPDAVLTVNDTVTRNYAHLTPLHPVAFTIPAEQQSGELREVLRVSDDAVQDVEGADIIVISIPLYNFNMPSALKAWIDHIVRRGKTFSYQTGRPEGLLKGKKVYLAIASAGVYSAGPMQPFDFAEPYLRYILGFIGLTDVTTFRIEGAGIPGIMETAVQKGLDSVVI
jgi:FMN-dependent NADH-azoreductase